MAKNIKITFFREKCIGNASCASAAPDQFLFNGKHAKLIDSTREIIDGNRVDAKTVSCDDDQKASIIEAGMSCPVNAIKVEDADSEDVLVSSEVATEGIKTIPAEYDDAKEFVIDPAGYFLIKVNQEKKHIEVAFCKDRNTVLLAVTGTKPIDIYHTILTKQGLDIRKDHAAYLGRELEKAYIALHYNVPYVQDEEIDFSTINQKNDT